MAGQPNRATAAVVSVEPATGAVRTMVGGPGFDSYKYNLATQNPRGVGSSMKTFVLATIMEQGYSPDDIINGLGPCQFADRTSENGVYDAGNYADGSGSACLLRRTSNNTMAPTPRRAGPLIKP